MARMITFIDLLKGILFLEGSSASTANRMGIVCNSVGRFVTKPKAPCATHHSNNSCTMYYHHSLLDLLLRCYRGMLDLPRYDLFAFPR